MKFYLKIYLSGSFYATSKNAKQQVTGLFILLPKKTFQKKDQSGLK